MGILPDRLRNRLLFDRKDFDLLRIVSDVLGREDLSSFKHLLTPYLHPRGVKELAATQGLRIAYAAANLLGSLEIGKAHDRLVALRALQGEVMNAAVTHLRRNTARVLMQIMKELVRTEGDERRRLELAHDFRMAATSKPRIVARLLKRYHLLMMPEDWVQVCFDNHVHDANTKGRKSATHLIMDAWIKGIRHLTVIYYNFVLPSVAEELLQAADIMGITVRVGIEFTTRFHDKPVKIIWVPRGFTGPSDFLNFLREPAMADFMQQGRSLARLQEEQILHVLGEFNSTILPDFNEYFGLNMPAPGVEGFHESVGAGQASLVHLGKYLHSMLLPHLSARFAELQAEYLTVDTPEDKAHIEGLAEEMNNLDAESIVDDYLDQIVSPEMNPDDPDGAFALYCPSQPPDALINSVSALRVGSRFILNLSGLSAADVLEILCDCGGRITHLEVVNLKNAAMGNAQECARIAELQEVVNAKSVIPLKRWVLGRMAQLEEDPSPDAPQRRERMARILQAVPSLHAHYRDRPLRTSLGSDSTGQSCRGHGMGMVARETLPRKVQNDRLGLSEDQHGAMVVGMRIEPQLLFEPRESTHPGMNALYAFARRHPALRFAGYKARRNFRVCEFHPVAAGVKSNILIMGGVKKGCGNNFVLEKKAAARAGQTPLLQYMNNPVRNALLVAAGFIPAFLTFALTKDWWVLCWFGAFIWFAITGLRNIIQSVLGGGGFSRTPLLKWNNYVSWSRLCESLFYTGFSVPLMDYLVKTVLMDRTLGMTVANDPALLYSIMAMINGVYIMTHNLIRGLPRQAALWNLLRSAFSIPLAMSMSAAVGWMLSPGDPAAAAPVLQQWAAIFSKLASDCVAGVIEGLADRENNMRQRLRDYREKITQMLTVQEKLELLFPADDVLGMLSDPKKFVNTLMHRRSDLANAVIVNSLDFLYFWMYQPRGRSALTRILTELDAQTRQIFLLSQYVLLRKREISQLFLDGLLGKNFSKGLAFYLDYADGYLDALQREAAKTQTAAARTGPRAGS